MHAITTLLTAPCRLTSRLPGSPRVLVASGAIALSLGLAACGSPGAAPGSDTLQSAATGETVSAPAPLTLQDGWVKSESEGMTAVFGTLHNNTEDDISLTGAESSSAKAAELHETVGDDSGNTLMQEKEGGFQVPARGALEFEPGGNHIMLMDLTEEIRPGDEVTLTLLSEAGEFEITLTAKEYAGAQEEYVHDQ